MTRTQVMVDSPYGFLYDKSYKICSEFEYKKAMKKAINCTKQKTVVPVFKNMFSDVKSYPKSVSKNINRSLIPPWLLKDYTSYKNETHVYLNRYAEQGCDPDMLLKLIPDRFKRKPEPEGIDRYLYFTKPLVAQHNMLAPDVIMTALHVKQTYYKRIMNVPPALTRSIGSQTLYRDSAAQTDPYSPEFLLRPGAQPELLNLIPFSYGNGLPGGLDEVKVLERARRRRLVEARFDINTTDLQEAHRRRRALDKLEIDEWHIREIQIEELQKARLKVISDHIKERKMFLLKMHEESMSRVFQEKSKQKDSKMNKVNYEFIKAMRRVLKERAKVLLEPKSNCLVDQYTDHMSQVWAPLTRIGQFLDHGSERYVVKNKYLTTFKGLEKLEYSLPPFITNPSLRIPKLNMYTNDGFKKKRYRFEDELAELYRFLKSKNQIAEETKSKPLKFLKMIEHSASRLPTPTMNFQNYEEEDQKLMVILVQQLIRGRAVQVMMYEGTRKRIDLIRELRSTHALEKAEIEIKRQEKTLVLALQRRRLQNDHQESTIEEVIQSLNSNSLGDIYDFLGKELERLKEERRIHAFIMMALRERRLREAEESGLRQLEERRRREEDEIFKQVVKMHQTTVDSYLECLLDRNIDCTAQTEAEYQVNQLAKTVNNEAYNLEPRRDYLQTEEIVSDLVHHFLIPEVYKMEARHQIEQRQKKFLLAAHREIVETANFVVVPHDQPRQFELFSSVETQYEPPPVQIEPSPDEEKEMELELHEDDHIDTDDSYSREEHP